MDTAASILDFLNRPDPSVGNYQKAIVQFRRRPDLIPVGAYLAAMEIIPDDSVGTACTDCVRKIIYSPTYFNTLTVEQCISALLHENLHKFLNFFPRFERWAARQDKKWTRGELVRIFNIAQDYFINWMIKHQWKLPLGEGWLYNASYTPDQYTTEIIADELLAKKDQAGANGGNQPPPPPAPCGDEDGDDEGSDEDSSGGDGPSDDTNESEETDAGDDASGGDGEGTEGDEDGEEEDSSGGAPSEGDDDSDEQDAGSAGDELDENDPTDPDDSEMGAGDDIMLPDEYNGDIDNALDESQMRSLETNNRQDMSDALRAAKGLAKSGNPNDPFTQSARDAAYKTGFNFRSELMRHANKAMKGGKYTWSRPNRRMKTAAGLPMPARRGKQIGTVVHIIDSSGSTDGPMVRYFLDEVTKAMRSLDYEKTVVIWCSEYVAKVFEFTKKEVDGGKALYNGIIYRKGYGTNFPPAFEYIAEHYRDVKVITYLTDGGVGEYDVRESQEIMQEAGLGTTPLLWLLAYDVEYEFITRFIEYTKKYRFGRCARLPMDEVPDE